jgi:hypothetical protein
LDFFGGLHWRYEEHVSLTCRKIDRIALFKTKEGLKQREGHTLNDEKYICPPMASQSAICHLVVQNSQGIETKSKQHLRHPNL